MKNVLLLLLTLLLAVAITAWFRYGGGQAYPDLTSKPLLRENQLQEVLSYPLPIGNVAVSRTGRVFFTVHPEARPKGNKLLESVNGAAVLDHRPRQSRHPIRAPARVRSRHRQGRSRPSTATGGRTGRVVPAGSADQRGRPYGDHCRRELLAQTAGDHCL